jgi:hypothetical protein
MMKHGLACLGAALLLSGLTMGCDDPVPPSAQGAVKYSIADSKNKTCSFKVTNTGIGGVDETTHTSVINGDNDALVTCQVTQEGNSYNVSASIKQNGDSFSVSGTVTPGQTSSLTVQVYPSISKNIYSSSPDQPCTATVVGTTPGKSSLGVGPGRIWASFSCPLLVQQGSMDAPSCAVAQTNSMTAPGGYFVFENCDQ